MISMKISKCAAAGAGSRGARRVRRRSSLTATDKQVCGIVQKDPSSDSTAADYVNTATAMSALAPSTTQPLRGDLVKAAQEADDQAVNSAYSATQTGSGSAVVDPAVFDVVLSDCKGG